MSTSHRDRSSKNVEQPSRPRRKSAKWLEKTAKPTAFGSLTSKKASKPVPRRLLKPGAVIRARIHFQDEEEYKARPCVVLSTTKQTVDVVPIFSIKKDVADRLKIVDYAAAGLKMPSYFKLRVECIEILETVERLGALSDDDHQQLNVLLTELKAS